MGKRNIAIDIMKSIAIIAVIIYHLGFLEYGYLGVDIFLVFSGYFMMKRYLSDIENDKFSYFGSVLQRVIRLLPIVLLAGAVTLGVGICVMMPDDLENAAQGVIASNFFMTNFLSMITTKNYWAISNNFRPLMHTWYLGILMQAYIIFPLLLEAIRHFGKKLLFTGILFLSLLSIMTYLYPFESSYTFYMLPFRAFELLFGAMVAFAPVRPRWGEKWILILSAVFLIVLIGVDSLNISDKQRLIFVTAATAVFLMFSIGMPLENDSKIFKLLSLPGRCSLSFFIWHQIVLAFYRYTVSTKVTGKHLVIYLALTILLSVLSYYLVETRLSMYIKRQNATKVVAGLCIACGVVSLCAGMLYLRAGVLYDIPELDITVKSAHRGMHAEYVDRIYARNLPYTNSNKTKVLIYGDSMGRDWGNILEESTIADKIEIYYIHPAHYDAQKHHELINKADIVFYATLGDATILPYELSAIPMEKIYVVGIKNYGECNGNIYSKRFSKDYFESSIELGTSFVEGQTYYEQNEIQKAKYGDHYIDLIAPLMNKDGTVSVFTDDHKYISSDCEHLTQAGAKYYARILDLEWITKR